LAVLIGAAAAYAAGGFDTFGATETFSPNAAGSATHPSPLGFTEHWTAKGSTGGNAAPLTKIVAKVYGVQYNGGKFPVCTATMINNAAMNKKHPWDNICPSGSRIGSGAVQSNLTGPKGTGGTPCSPLLEVYNGGKNTQTFFFVLSPSRENGKPIPAKYSCAAGTVHTGTGCAAYSGTLSHSGKTAIETINLPGCASTDAGNIGAYAALQTQKVTYKTLTKKVNGKTIGYEQSVACSHGQRPWSFTFTAQNFKGQSPSTMTQTVSGKQACT
jgi:hypothetical protein